MKTSTLRLHSVRFRSGGAEFRVFNSDDRDLRAVYDSVTYRVAESHQGTIAGFAVVIWGPDNSSTCACRIGNASKIPSIFAPDFVRNRLLADRIESWTIDTINKK